MDRVGACARFVIFHSCLVAEKAACANSGFSAPYGIPVGWNALADDLFATVARGRVLECKVAYSIEKIQTPSGNALVVNSSCLAGTVEDLYDFSGEDGLPGIMAAIIQLGHGNGSYGPTRSSGVIFRDRIEFNQTVRLFEK